jgi:hypothetical protein
MIRPGLEKCILHLLSLQTEKLTKTIAALSLMLVILGGNGILSVANLRC